MKYGKLHDKLAAFVSVIESFGIGKPDTPQATTDALKKDMLEQLSQYLKSSENTLCEEKGAFRGIRKLLESGLFNQEDKTQLTPLIDLVRAIEVTESLENELSSYPEKEERFKNKTCAKEVKTLAFEYLREKYPGSTKSKLHGRQ